MRFLFLMPTVGGLTLQHSRLFHKRAFMASYFYANNSPTGMLKPASTAWVLRTSSVLKKRQP